MVRPQCQTQITGDVTYSGLKSWTTRDCIGDNNNSDDDDDDDGEQPYVKVVVRRGQTGNMEDGAEMARLHSRAICARLREAKRLVDDTRFEYGYDVVFECQRG
ncbi:hypothetical protein FBU59_001281 [Linderina macrospora]|uniref:Uncharacterized protein n=1 Tax=Linderina macrospora TaxID=4868 RepID=A0ACC1JEK5_9FUNG|nr:hypothetical protein FBU59_001281 [Linderina macrospora]